MSPTTRAYFDPFLTQPRVQSAASPMCLAPHMASLTVPVKALAAAYDGDRESAATNTRVRKKKPAFRVRTLITVLLCLVVGWHPSKAGGTAPFIKMRHSLGGYKPGSSYGCSPRPTWGEPPTFDFACRATIAGQFSILVNQNRAAHPLARILRTPKRRRLGMTVQAEPASSYFGALTVYTRSTSTVFSPTLAVTCGSSSQSRLGGKSLRAVGRYWSR